ncbi:MAG: FHA domain-containing protein [Gammaproteobacteria bacterium]|nr:FHA domain-containing protein [Gammaproteobacteria bacterium]
MTNPMAPITYLMYVDGETIPIEDSMTMGNHLDNDVIVPGEDVADFHVRIDLSERGPVLIPLSGNTLNLNGVETDKPVQVIIGDVVTVGQTTTQIGTEIEHASEAEAWSLYAELGEDSYAIVGEVSVGRTDSADITVMDHHISRFHARFVERDNFIWLQDLGSANGTRVNGLPLVGGGLLFHGDIISFDKINFQLIGRGGDLTPVQQFEEPFKGTALAPPKTPSDSTEFVSADGEDREAAQAPLLEVPLLNEIGAFLLGASQPVDGTVFRIVVGDSVIGRAEDCEIVVDDASISQQHAQLSMKPEGVTLTDLMSTNGIKVNGTEANSSTLKDGDIIRIGRVSFVFKNLSDENIEQHELLGRIQPWVIGAALAAGILLLAIVVF